MNLAHLLPRRDASLHDVCDPLGWGARAADLDITGPSARVRFLDAVDEEYAVLEGGSGWLNASTQRWLRWTL